ncbi:uncharacterized protein LOC127835005 [Dreissena polymorpha]|uniref:uncharacterized protein LOC127835005 n=1 Tax=Dreissena polymorpha TaxID=45954 RepID=UPI00226541CA|nr:uncharacterized protein LOC127835005 [Dreissena polymorpha]
MLIVCAVLTFASFLPLVENAGSSKKGIGAAAATLKCDDFRVLNNISWWYDWTQHYQQLTNHCTASNVHVPEFVPMVRVLHSNETAQNIHIPPGSHFVLGYNEPDLVTLNNMAPQQAAMYWPMVEKAAVGIPLLAPVSYKHDFVWLDQFFQHCDGCRIDYVAALL